MNYLKTMILASSIALSHPIFAQMHDVVDVRNSAGVSLIMVGDASYSVKKMVLNTIPASQLLGGVSSQYAMQQISSAIISQCATDVTTSIAPDLVAMFKMTGIPYLMVAYTVAEIAMTIASVDNVQSRNYFVYAPVAGTYTFDVWVPGDADKPCSMIKIFSISDEGQETLRSSYDQVAVSDRVIRRQVELPKGLCHINVSVGSGTVKFHSAGNLQLAMLSNASPVQWTLPNIPVTVTQVGLFNYLPTVGSSTSISANTSIPSTPANILDGTVSYANIHPIPAVFRPDAVNTGASIHFYAEPTEEELQQLGTWPHLNMKAAQVGDVVGSSSGGTWTLTRLPDYTTNYVVRGIYHLY